MLRTLRLLAAMVLCVATSRAQSKDGSATPDQGSVTDSVYTNQFFGITWELPRDWSIAPSNPPSGQVIPLLQAHPGGERSTDFVSLTAQDFSNVHGFGFQYMDALRPVMEKNGWQSLKNHGYYTLGGGIPAYRGDYTHGTPPTRFSLVLAGPARGYEVKVLIESDSSERVQDLLKTVLTLKVRPDWKAPDASMPKPGDAPAEVPKRVRVSVGVLESFASKKVPPIYPTEARRDHTQGSVSLLVHVDQSGMIEDIYVEEGNPVLAKAAVEAVSQWHYTPYLLSGAPAKLESMVIVNFQLH